MRPTPFLAILYSVAGMLIMDRRVIRISNGGALPCLKLKNPRHDVMVFLLVESNLDRIFVDLAHDRCRFIQILSERRSLFESLRHFDGRGGAKTCYARFLYPDGRADSVVRSIQVWNPTDAHLFILLKEYQPKVRKISWRGTDVWVKFCGLASEVEQMVYRMFDEEAPEPSTDMDTYLFNSLKRTGIYDYG